MKAVAELNYTPNAFARGLATNRSGGIGVTLNDIGSPFFGAMLRGIEERLEEHGVHMLVSSGQLDAAKERDAIEFLEQRRSDALIVQSEALSDHELLDLARRSDVPFVVYGRWIAELDGVCIYLDNEAGGALATRHLLAHGHRRIAHLSGSLASPDARQRMQGYRDALAEAGLAFDDRYVVEGDYQEAGGYAAMKRLLERELPLDAVFAANDQMAAGAMRAAREHGLNIPHDLSFIGYDDVVLAQYVTPALTTVRQPLRDMGHAAADVALALLNDETKEVRTRFEPEVVERESVAKRPH
jgi:LacI family transcriptional regulator